MPCSLKHITLLLLLASMACNLPTKRKAGFEVHGIDISHHQKRIDWQAVVQSDIQFAFVKATEGADHTDSLFCENWDALSNLPVHRGAYHFFRPRTDPVQQFANFAAMVDLHAGDLAPVLDVEVTDGVEAERLRASMSVWLKMAETHYGIKPVIYTNQKFFNRFLAGHFDEYPLWVARYNHWFSPWLRAGKRWAFWQYGNRGQMQGIEGDVDFNVFAGTLQDLHQCCVIKTITELPPISTPMAGSLPHANAAP